MDERTVSVELNKGECLLIHYLMETFIEKVPMDKIAINSHVGIKIDDALTRLTV